MSINEAIEQLKDLKLDRESFINNNTEHDNVFIKDIKAIDIVLQALEEYKEIAITEKSKRILLEEQLNSEYLLRHKFENICKIALEITGPVKIDEDSMHKLKNGVVIEENDYSCNSRIYRLKKVGE